MLISPTAWVPNPSLTTSSPVCQALSACHNSRVHSSSRVGGPGPSSPILSTSSYENRTQNSRISIQGFPVGIFKAVHQADPKLSIQGPTYSLKQAESGSQGDTITGGSILLSSSKEPCAEQIRNIYAPVPFWYLTCGNFGLQRSRQPGPSQRQFAGMLLLSQTHRLVS